MPQMLPERAPRWALDPIVRLLVAARLTPSGLSWTGFAGNIAAAWLVAEGHLAAGGIVMLAASALDLLDGALARATGQATAAGALLDSTLDRASEAVVLFGLLAYEIDAGHREEALLVFATVVGSLLVSYVRARAESLNVALRAGLFRRQERVVLLAVGLATGWLRPVLWVMAVATVGTAAQRLWLGMRALRERA